MLDLSVVADVGAAAPYDWVLSLEVGEHLPKRHEAAFLENCHRHNARGMVLSWATRGQGGTGHVNEQDNDYVKAAVCAMGSHGIWYHVWQKRSMWRSQRQIFVRKPFPMRP